MAEEERYRCSGPPPQRDQRCYATRFICTESMSQSSTSVVKFGWQNNRNSNLKEPKSERLSGSVPFRLLLDSSKPLPVPCRGETQKGSRNVIPNTAIWYTPVRLTYMTFRAVQNTPVHLSTHGSPLSQFELTFQVAPPVDVNKS